MKKDNRKTTKKGTRKGTAKQAEPFTTASKRVEDIEEEAGDVARVAHICFFATDECPPFLRDTINDAIARAAKQLNMPDPDETKDDEASYRQLIELFKATGEDFTLDDPRGDVADELARVLSNPKLPQGVWAGIVDALNELNSSTDIYKNPEVVRAVLKG
jgi:hypothetical protein